ncbi:hypothetical protein, partial [Paenibacillus sp. 598K]|uniref:hypothetical protein n=1 Tax=Paenibacillus sp. 598K TaxID=1117987 RepID=UPI001C8895F8
INRGIIAVKQFQRPHENRTYVGHARIENGASFCLTLQYTFLPLQARLGADRTLQRTFLPLLRSILADQSAPVHLIAD